MARVLVEKHHIGLGELTDRMADVKSRYAGGLRARTRGEAEVRRGRLAVKRNRHHIHAVGKGDPQVYAGQAGTPKFSVGDPVRVRDELPAFFYTRTPEYVPGRQR